jgi:hypothetical protein
MSNVVVARRLAAGPATRVVADVADHEVWFEANLPLTLSPEVMASAFLLVCAHHRQGLDLDVPLSSRFRGNLTSLQEVVREFWSYQDVPLLEPPGGIPSTAGKAAPEFRGAALMFSGGVDSFYSLLRGPLAPAALVLVEGFDIPLTQPSRTEAAWASLQAVADHFGLRAVKVSTNLREHALFRSVNWEVTHGGALAAMGHLLAAQYSHVIISSSYPYPEPTKPWGSHFRLDPHWSSDVLSVLHVGATHRRAAKLLAIADEPIVQRNLRVCWEGVTTQLNCGACEKCIRTLLVLQSVGRLEHFTTFATSESQLTDAVRALPYIKNRGSLANSYTRFVRANPSSTLGREVAALIERSKRYHRKRELMKSVAGRIVSRILY